MRVVWLQRGQNWIGINERVEPLLRNFTTREFFRHPSHYHLRTGENFIRYVIPRHIKNVFSICTAIATLHLRTPLSGCQQSSIGLAHGVDLSESFPADRGDIFRGMIKFSSHHFDGCGERSKRNDGLTCLPSLLMNW